MSIYYFTKFKYLPTCMNGDDHVSHVHEVRQVVQCEPHRQVAQCYCGEACPEKT